VRLEGLTEDFSVKLFKAAHFSISELLKYIFPKLSPKDPALINIDHLPNVFGLRGGRHDEKNI
jgi:hypothetical protein